MTFEFVVDHAAAVQDQGLAVAEKRSDLFFAYHRAIDR